MRSRTLIAEWVYLFARRDDFRATAIKSMVGTSALPPKFLACGLMV